MEDVQGVALVLFDPPVHEVEESEHDSQASTLSGPTSYLPLLIAVFGFARDFQVAPFRLSKGVRLTTYPLFSTSPLLRGLCLGMFAF